jgi:hypothetical protein
MTQIIIPTNTNNSISKVIEIEYGSTRGVLFLGSYQAANDALTLKQYKIASILTIASDLTIKSTIGVTHKTIPL